MMLTTSDSDGDIQRAMRAGAAAYILKTMPKEEILGVLQSVHTRGRFMLTWVAARKPYHSLQDADRKAMVLSRGEHTPDGGKDRIMTTQTDRIVI